MAKPFIGQLHDNINEVKLDKLDRKILAVLSENGRLSNTYIANLLKTKREVVAYRIKKMTEHEFLHGYLTLIDTRKLGKTNYVVYFKIADFTKANQFFDELHSMHDVTRLKNCSGVYDMQVIFTTDTIENFDKLFQKVVSKYSHCIKDYVILNQLEENFTGINFLSDTYSHYPIEKKGSAYQKEFLESVKQAKEIKVDKEDKKILNYLKLNGRDSVMEISKHVALSPATVDKRVKNLVRNGVIKGFVPMASISALGYQWYKVFLQTKNLDETKFLAFLKNHANVLWYMRFIGKYSYQFSIFAKDNAEFNSTLNEIRKEFSENIISHNSIIVFNQFKFVQLIE